MQQQLCWSNTIKLYFKWEHDFAFSSVKNIEFDKHNFIREKNNYCQLEGTKI